MQATARRDTPAELNLRSELHRRGLRFRVDKPVIPGSRTRPDIVFPRLKVAVFVNGCFWHCCPEHGTSPKRNRAWWQEKLESNVARDHRIDAALIEAGWHVMRIWEHEPAGVAADRIAQSLVAR